MPRSWPDKFRSAGRGLWLATTRERSFAVHLPAAVAVGLGAAVLQVSLTEACILGLCVAMVVAAEIFNTSIEYLAREITTEHRPGIAAALDMASGAVLVVALFAAGIGGFVFLARLGIVLAWWK
jgi:diacylglycerol kinase (ATP)